MTSDEDEMMPLLSPSARSYPQARATPAPAVSKALSYFGGRSPAQAKLIARSELERCACSCCPTLLVHVYNRMGMTFFLDEDPEVLVRSFAPAEREIITPRVMAGCIVLLGRERVAVYPSR